MSARRDAICQRCAVECKMRIMQARVADDSAQYAHVCLMSPMSVAWQRASFAVCFVCFAMLRADAAVPALLPERRLRCLSAMRLPREPARMFAAHAASFSRR